MTHPFETLPDAVAAAPAEAPAVIKSLVERHGAQWVDEVTLDAWMAGGGERVLLLAGDPVRFPEGLDVAVVLPEIQRALCGRFVIGVVRRSAEEAVARLFGSSRWPSLVFVRDGRYVSTLPGMYDWEDYVTRVEEALAMPATRIPGIGIAVVSAAPGTGCG